MATPGVGSDIEDICTRCGDTWHVVMAKVGERVAKVVCKLCGGQHNYRGDQQPAAAGTSRLGQARGGALERSVSRAQQRLRRQWWSLTPASRRAPTRPRAGYLPGERVTHATFGVGVVSGVPGPGKVEVHFPERRAHPGLRQGGVDPGAARGGAGRGPARPPARRPSQARAMARARVGNARFF
jgi:hypothetical protein